MYAFAEYVWLAAQLWWPAWAVGTILLVLPCALGALARDEINR